MNLRCAGVLQSVEKLRAVTVNRAERRPVSYHFRFFVDDASDFACEIVIKSQALTPDGVAPSSGPANSMIVATKQRSFAMTFSGSGSAGKATQPRRQTPQTFPPRVRGVRGHAHGRQTGGSASWLPNPDRVRNRLPAQANPPASTSSTIARWIASPSP